MTAGLRKDCVRPKPRDDVAEGLFNKLGGRIDCDVVGFSVLVLLSAGVVPVWYIERGLSCPNLEPETDAPRAKGIDVAGFGNPVALVLDRLLSSPSMAASASRAEREIAFNCPSCGRRLRRFGLLLPELGEGEASLMALLESWFIVSAMS